MKAKIMKVIAKSSIAVDLSKFLVSTAVFLFFVPLAHADSTTPRLGLILPTVGSPTWGQKVNGNFQILDATVNVAGTNFILNQNTLQSGAAFYVSSGSVSGKFRVTDPANPRNWFVYPDPGFGLGGFINFVQPYAASGGGGSVGPYRIVVSSESSLPALTSNDQSTLLFYPPGNAGNPTGAIAFGFGNNTALKMTPSGTIISGLTYPTADGSSGQFMKTDGSGNLSFGTVSGGGGYAVHPATVTFQLDQGVTATTGTFSGLVSMSTFTASSATVTTFYTNQLGLNAAGNTQANFTGVSDGSALLTGSNNTFGHVLDIYNANAGNPSYLRYSADVGLSGKTTFGYAGFGVNSRLNLLDNTGALYMSFVYGSVPAITIGDPTRDSFISFGNASINFDAAPTPLLFTGSPFVFNASVTTNAPIVANSTIQVNNMMMDSSGSVGTLNQVLASQGAGVPPKWQAQSGSGGGGYNVEPASVTFLLDKGVRVSTLNVNGSTLTINGITYTNWPSTLSNIPATSSGVFIVSGSSQVSVQPAITDPAETGITNTFIASQTVNGALGLGVKYGISGGSLTLTGLPGAGTLFADASGHISTTTASGGSGDMILASTQTVTGAKTFTSSITASGYLVDANGSHGSSSGGVSGIQVLTATSTKTGPIYQTIGVVVSTAGSTTTNGINVCQMTASAGTHFINWSVLASQASSASTTMTITVTYSDGTTTSVSTGASSNSWVFGNAGSLLRWSSSSGFIDVTAGSAKPVTQLTIASSGGGTGARGGTISAEQVPL